MSTNISSVKTLVLDAWMTAADVIALHAKHKPNLPDVDLFDGMLPRARRAIDEGCPDRQISIERFWWSGEWSGAAESQAALMDIGQHVMGRVEVVLCSEDGDITGLLIRDGKVVECAVEMRVVKPEGWDP